MVFVQFSLLIDHRVDLPPAIHATRRTLLTSAGTLSYYYAEAEQRESRALVLLHSINAAASAYEVRPLFEQFRGQRPVYAADLPGFGFSDRGDRAYSPALYGSAILDFMASVVRSSADVIALSLTSEFAVRAAITRPSLFHTLTIVSPTGFSERSARTGAGDFRYRALAAPLWSQAVFDLLTTKPAIRHYLSRSFEGPIDEGLAAYDYATAHQPGARYAPLYFVGGKMYTPDALDVLYDRIRVPVIALYDRDGYTDFDRLPDFVRDHSNWTAARIPGTLGLPHFEKPAETAAALDRFWTEAAVA